jgi:ABC-type uncharacterized transport system auxiliary subunit
MGTGAVEENRSSSMRRIWQTALVVVLAGISAGCGASHPIKYYVLDVSPAPAISPAAQFPVTLLIGRVTASHLYRDDRLVYGSGPVELGTYEYQRWAESPADMVQDILISSLRSAGQYRSVSRIESNFRGDYILRGHLYDFYEVDKPQLAARLSLQLELFDPKSGTTVWTDSYSHDEPAKGKTVADIVEALDRNVQAGMQQFTANLGQYFSTHPQQSQAAAE